MIKLIGFEISGHDLFENNSEFMIQTSGQITQNTKNRIISFNDNLTLNRVIGIVGLNATGKSTVMSMFHGINDLLLLEKSIDQTSLENTLRSKDDKVDIRAYLADTENMSYRIDLTFSYELSNQETNEWVISEEKVFSKKAKSIAKSKYFSFSDKNIVINRSEQTDNVKKALSNKDSIFKLVNTNLKVGRVISTVSETDRNIIRTFADQTPIELLEYLDNSIEYLEYINDDNDSNNRVSEYKIKFKDSERIYTYNSFVEIANILSSGTVKGITLFFVFLNALRVGATLFVDEIELHINKRIVQDFIGFFADKSINVNDATLVYSTHYLELTDDLVRSDEEYILTRSSKTKIDRLANTKVRVELKKSELFQNNYIKGTAPNYSRYKKLKNAVKMHNTVRSND